MYIVRCIAKAMNLFLKKDWRGLGPYSKDILTKAKIAYNFKYKE